MIKFVPKGKNLYATKSDDTIKGDNAKVMFISQSSARNLQMFRNSAANITGRKVLFKHVW